MFSDKNAHAMLFVFVKNLNENGTEQVKAATIGVKKPDLAHY